MHDTVAERYHVCGTGMGNSLCDKGKTMFLYLSSAETVTPLFKGLSVIPMTPVICERVENITDSTFQITAVGKKQINQQLFHIIEYEEK